MSDQDVFILAASAKERISRAMDEAVVTLRQMPIRPWRDMKGNNVEEMVISVEQQIIVVPEETWDAVIDGIPKALDALASQVVSLEERATAEWRRANDLEERVATARDGLNRWRSKAEDPQGVLYSSRFALADARVAELETALAFYADPENWKPEPRITEAGVSVNDRGGIARSVLDTSGGKS